MCPRTFSTEPEKVCAGFTSCQVKSLRQETFREDDPKQYQMEQGSRGQSSDVEKEKRRGMRMDQSSSVDKFHRVSPIGGLWKQNILQSRPTEGPER